MRIAILLAAALFLTAACSRAGEERNAAPAGPGLLVFTASMSVGETMDRLEQAAKERGFKVFARIDHAAGAASVGAVLRPTELLIFGNPQGGTPLMQKAQTIAIDLPLKALAWQDAEGVVHLGFNDPAFLFARHGMTDAAPMIARMTGLLSGLAEAAGAN
ncbi:MAG: hypothetical protein Tsb008_10020 [Rhodothalassiaceae bacterium]